jgi:small-conductance mechanosensitive channel
VADNAEPEYIQQASNSSLEEQIESLARRLLDGKEDNAAAVNDLESARAAARRILEDSEARTQEGADLEPEDEHVIRRTSDETAATGEAI